MYKPDYFGTRLHIKFLSFYVSETAIATCSLQIYIIFLFITFLSSFQFFPLRCFRLMSFYSL